METTAAKVNKVITCIDEEPVSVATKPTRFNEVRIGASVINATTPTTTTKKDSGKNKNEGATAIDRSHGASAVNPKVVLVSIHGNIGSGKSTLIGPLMRAMKYDTRLNKFFSAIVHVDEPLGSWLKPYTFEDDVKRAYSEEYSLRNVDVNAIEVGAKGDPFDFDNVNNTPLGMFYKSPSTEAFPFQLNALCSRVLELKNSLKYHFDERTCVSVTSRGNLGKHNGSDVNCQTDPSPILVVSERSIFSDRHVFMLAQIENGNLTPNQAAVYDQVYNTIVETNSGDVTMEKVMIHISTRHPTCHARIRGRGRNEEKNVSLAYLKTLEKYHEKMFNSFDGTVLTIDGDRPLETTMGDINRVVKELGDVLCK